MYLFLKKGHNQFVFLPIFFQFILPFLRKFTEAVWQSTLWRWSRLWQFNKIKIASISKCFSFSLVDDNSTLIPSQIMILGPFARRPKILQNTDQGTQPKNFNSPHPPPPPKKKSLSSKIFNRLATFFSLKLFKSCCDLATVLMVPGFRLALSRKLYKFHVKELHIPVSGDEPWCLQYSVHSTHNSQSANLNYEFQGQTFFCTY